MGEGEGNHRGGKPSHSPGDPGCAVASGDRARKVAALLGLGPTTLQLRRRLIARIGEDIDWRKERPPQQASPP